MVKHALLIVMLGVLLTGCDSRPVVVLGSLVPKAADAGTRGAAGREADDDVSEREDAFEGRD